MVTVGSRGRLRDADELLAPAVAETVRRLDLADADAAAVRLAERYAAQIDAAPVDERTAVMERLGPKLLDVLDALGATPRGRARIGKGGASGEQGRLAKLRAARPA